MAFSLPALPFATQSLEPHISQKTLEIHHGKHHQTYVDNLNRLLAEHPLPGDSIESIMQSADKHPNPATLFNNAAQVWNHTFYWQSLSPQGGGAPKEGPLKEEILKAFGSVNAFKEQFKAEALAQFGSGWAWLVIDAQGKLAIQKTGNADCPLVSGAKPLLVCDVWEHAYYLDYQNKRANYVDVFLNHLINWSFAEERFRS